MLIDEYFHKSGNEVRFTRQRASDFAKIACDDFNPLHDIGAKRFCVPGDLLFSLVLSNYGVSEDMEFTFTGMVTDEVTLILPVKAAILSIKGENEKEYLSVKNSGVTSHDSSLIDNLTNSYVTFSGHTFPHVLVPLLEQQQVMLNPDRPMVMYQSMLIHLDSKDLTDISLKFDQDKTSMEVNGKRGKACLGFNLIADDQVIGYGEKRMVLSGLKPFDKHVVDKTISDYVQWKENFVSG